MSYYVHVRTRGPGGKSRGSSVQALNYLADGGGQRHPPAISDPELSYIARLGPGWKTEQEGGRVPLIGLGLLRGIQDPETLRDLFSDACRPEAHSLAHGARTGYLSLVFTAPKELSLYAEGHREPSREAMYAAAERALAQAFPNKALAAVAALHTRNEDGEIHHHLHVLLAKFARDASGRSCSLNSKRGGNTGNERLDVLKTHWKAGLEREFQERMGLIIEQARRNGPVTLRLPDGTALSPLNRATRRMLEKQLEPSYARLTATGEIRQTRLKLSEMDNRIFEVAAGQRGRDGWSVQAFREAFPEQIRYLKRYEARVETLRQVGYLSAEGRITQAFRTHHAAKYGQETPELQRIRLELSRASPLDADCNSAPLPPPESLWDVLQRFEALQRRAQRLGYSPRDLERALGRAARFKPSPAVLDRIRLEAEYEARKRAEAQVQAGKLPSTRTVGSAFLALQRARIQRAYLVAAGAFRGDFTQRKLLADQLVRRAGHALREARERRWAQLDHRLRPVFRVVQLLAPRTAARLERARRAMIRIAAFRESTVLARQELDRRFAAWRADLHTRTLAELQARVQAQAREETRARLREQLPGKEQDLGRELRQFLRGQEELERHRPAEAEHLRTWKGREAELVSRILARARGEEVAMPQETHSAALKAGRIGSLVEKAGRARPLSVPRAYRAESLALHRISARLEALGIRSPFTAKALGEMAPAELRQALGRFRELGMDAEGGAWVFQATRARALAAELERSLGRGGQGPGRLP